VNVSRTGDGTITLALDRDEGRRLVDELWARSEFANEIARSNVFILDEERKTSGVTNELSDAR
jgi:hypothetical protein